METNNLIVFLTEEAQHRVINKQQGKNAELVLAAYSKSTSKKKSESKKKSDEECGNCKRKGHVDQDCMQRVVVKKGKPLGRTRGMLCFHNSCQLCLHLRLSCDFLSTNSVPRHMTVGYHIIFVPLFTQTFLQDSPSYSQVLPYVNTILSSSVDINSDSLLYISTLDFVFQGTGMHGTIFTIYHMFIPCLRNSL